MTKDWYNKNTGDQAVFGDSEDMSNWPDFQETRPPSPPFLIAAQRAARDKMLADSDAWATADRITEEIKVYRQALRDVPAQSGFPWDHNWPTVPSVMTNG